MKIALVIDHFHPKKGGAERSLQEILSTLHDRGHALQLAAMSWDKSIEARMEVHRVSVAGFPRWRRDLLFARNSSALMKGLAPDITLGVRHTPDVDIFLARNGLYCESLKATLRAKPSVFRRITQNFLPKHRVLLDLERQLFTRHDSPLVLAPSNVVKQHCLKNFNFPSARVQVIPNGVNLQKFSPVTAEKRRELREQFGIQDKTVFLFAAHNFRLKGFDCLLEAWRGMNPQKNFLLVVGRDNPPARAKQFGNIKFLGERSDALAIYQSADVLVHPSFSDTFGRVIIEALACGLPVITTRLAGASELMTDGREGFVLDDPRQISNLTEKMLHFTDGHFLKSFSKSARELAEQFPQCAYVEKTAEAIESEGKRKTR